MADGRIAERGTFDEMMENRGEFSRTFDEFVTKGQGESEEKAVDVEDVDLDENAKKRRASRRGAALMQAEERNVGAVNLQVYKRYFQSGNGVVLLPTMFVSIVLMQTSVVLSSYWYVLSWYLSLTSQMLMGIHIDRLVWWQERCVFLQSLILLPLIPQYSQWPRPQGFYVCLNLLTVYL